MILLNICAKVLYIAFVVSVMMFACYTVCVYNTEEVSRDHNIATETTTPDRIIDLSDEIDYGFYVIEAEVTAYCPCEKCCGKFADGITANGHVINKGDKFVAAGKKVPFETQLTIPGYGTVLVLDRGGVIKGNKLDVYFDTHEEALEWGKQTIDIIVWSDND